MFPTVISMGSSRHIRVGLVLCALIVLGYWTLSSLKPTWATKERAPLIHQPSIVPSKPEPDADHQPETTSYLRAGETLQNTNITSPSGRYLFTLQSSGQLALIDLHRNTTLFTSDTALTWPVSWLADFGSDGVLTLNWARPDAAPYHGTVWMSTQLPGCPKPLPSEDESAPAVLEILDSGQLQIRRGDHVTCVLHTATADKGRLGVVLAGFMRSVNFTCDSHVSKVLSKWSGSKGVGLHLFSYAEDIFKDDAVDLESFKERVRECYGDYLKTFEVVPVATVREEWDDVNAAVREACGIHKVHRLLSQVKSVYRTGQQMAAYMIQNGIQYDYILRLRPDHMLWGEVPDLDQVDPGIVITPNPANEKVYFCSSHHGLLRTGSTDQMAYGQASAMWTYLNMYPGFKSTLEMSKSNPGPFEGFASSSSHDVFDVPDKERCPIECLTEYWLYLNGLTVQVDWRWQQSLMRSDGHLDRQCPDPDRHWNCPGGIPPVT